MTQLTTMKTHLIINIRWKCILMLLILTLGGWGKAWGQWNGATYYVDQTINMTGNVTMTGTMIIAYCTVTINANGADRTITRGSSFSSGSLFAIATNGKLVINGGSNTIIIDGNNVNTTSYGACIQSIDFQGCKAQLSNVTIKNHKRGDQP